MSRERVITASVLTPVAIAAVLWLPTPWLASLTAAVMLVGLWEWARLIGVAATLPRIVLLTAHAAAMAALAWSAGPGLLAFNVLALIGVLWWLAAALWLRRFEFLSAAGAKAEMTKLVAGTLAILPAWCALVLLHADPAFGPRWTLFAVALVWAADSGAYYAGSRYGKTKLAPRISPGKTWAGVWGGVAASLVLATLAFPLLGIDWTQLAALWLLTALAVAASIVGDLFESLLKRHAGDKDSGALFPGHGGMLDRIDSLLAALPVFAVGKSLLGL